MKVIALIVPLIWFSCFFVFGPMIIQKPDLNIYIADHSWPPRKLSVCAEEATLKEAVKWAVSEWDGALEYFGYRLFIPQIASLGFRETNTGEGCEIFITYMSEKLGTTVSAAPSSIAAFAIKPRQSINPEQIEVSLDRSLGNHPEKLRMVVLHYLGHSLGLAHVVVREPMKRYPILTAIFHGQKDIPEKSSISSLEAYALYKKYFGSERRILLGSEREIGLPETMPFIVYGDFTTDIGLGALSTFIIVVALFLSSLLMKEMVKQKTATPQN